MQNIFRVTLTFAFIFLGVVIVLGPGIASAATADDIQCGVNAAAGAQGCAPDPNASTTLDNTISNVINILSIIVGVVAVIMIIFGGYRYITSGGDASKVTSAKNTLIYAIIGLIIAALAQIIVKFVLNEIDNPSATGSSSQSSGSGNQNPPPCVPGPGVACPQ